MGPLGPGTCIFRGLTCSGILHAGRRPGVPMLGLVSAPPAGSPSTMRRSMARIPPTHCHPSWNHGERAHMDSATRTTRTSPDSSREAEQLSGTYDILRSTPALGLAWHLFKRCRAATFTRIGGSIRALASWARWHSQKHTRHYAVAPPAWVWPHQLRLPLPHLTGAPRRYIRQLVPTRNFWPGDAFKTVPRPYRPRPQHLASTRAVPVADDDCQSDSDHPAEDDTGSPWNQDLNTHPTRSAATTGAMPSARRPPPTVRAAPTPSTASTPHPCPRRPVRPVVPIGFAAADVPEGAHARPTTGRDRPAVGTAACLPAAGTSTSPRTDRRLGRNNSNHHMEDTANIATEGGNSQTPLPGAIHNAVRPASRPREPAQRVP